MKQHKWLILGLLVTAQLLVVLDHAIVNVSLPALKAALGFEQSNLQWVVTAYALTFGGFLLLGGRAADLFGRRRVLLGGVIGFTIVSLLVGFAQSSEMMIALRASQGIAAAFMSSAALSILLTSFEEGKERNKALSMWAAAGAGGAALGVFLGGIITEYLGWRWNFFINIPIGLLVAFGIAKYIPAHFKEEKDKQLDVWGAVLVTSGLMLLVYALSGVPTQGLTSPLTVGLFILSIALLAGFIINEHKVARPLMPLSIFRIGNVGAANLVMASVFAGVFGMFFFSSLFVQNVLDYPPVLTGLSFLPVPLVVLASTRVAPRLLARFGFKRLLIVGTSLTIVGTFLLSLISEQSTFLTGILPGLVIMAAGMGITFVTVSVAATSGVQAREAGLASGLLNTSQQMGGAIGLAVLSSVAASVTTAAPSAQPDAALVAGYSAAFLTASALMAVALLVSIFAIREDMPKRGAQVPDS